MDRQDLADHYNYDSFVPHKFEPWLNFEQSPPVGQKAPDFPLWTLEGEEMPLSAL